VEKKREPERGRAEITPVIVNHVLDEKEGTEERWRGNIKRFHTWAVGRQVGAGKYV